MEAISQCPPEIQTPSNHLAKLTAALIKSNLTFALLQQEKLKKSAPL